jgi:lysozyme family protein
MSNAEDFNICFAITIGHEGGFQNDLNDKGNWTGGAVGAGVNKGTNWGISAASYPKLDIKNLSLAEAKLIYHKDYWSPAGCPMMPGAMALVMFDAAVNNGVSNAIRFMQQGLGVGVDGIIGVQTTSALKVSLEADPDGMAQALETHARRLVFMSGLGTWQTYALGWSRRLVTIPAEAAANWPPEA